METAESLDNGGGTAGTLEMFIHPIADGQVDKDMLDKLRAGKA